MSFIDFEGIFLLPWMVVVESSFSFQKVQNPFWGGKPVNTKCIFNQRNYDFKNIVCWSLFFEYCTFNSHNSPVRTVSLRFQMRESLYRNVNVLSYKTVNQKRDKHDIYPSDSKIQANVWQYPRQCCEVISLHLIKINEKKKYKLSS